MGRPVCIRHPISNPLNRTGVGQWVKVYFEAAASWFTLNSDPAGNFPAMHTSCFTLSLTSSSPLSLEYSSGEDSRRLERLVRNPTVTIVTLLSGWVASTFL